MKTEQINIRLEPDLVAALERVAREESLDRGTVIRRLLENSIRRWELERALRGYQREELSLGRAAEDAGLTQWELMDLVREAGIAYPLEPGDVEERLSRLPQHAGSQASATLPDIPPSPGGVLLVGINPHPVSVAAGHYYQGRLGKRLWRRLERAGLLEDPIPGAEDEAFARAGHGLTDLVKRPTAAAAEIGQAELRDGVDALRAKVRQWRPGLVLFAFKESARQVLGKAVAPGAGPALEGAATFLLSGPYAPRAEAERIDRELREALGQSIDRGAGETAHSQPVTERDREHGRIRLPSAAKRFFPSEGADVDVILRGRRITCRYDPRLGPDRERSAVLSVGKTALAELVRPDEVLRVRRGLGGVALLD
jgi:TDG/mug DNA glycosylase family protein